MRVIPVRFKIMVAGRANHRNDRDVPEGKPLSRSWYCTVQPKCVGETVRADYKLTMMPTSLFVFHSHQARYRVYLYGAPSPVKIDRTKYDGVLR